MPTYDYVCSNCDYVETKVVSIAKRDDPLKDPCPKCNDGEHRTRPVQSPMMTAMVGDVYSKTPDGFKDVLRNIKAGSGTGCTIDV